jgi:tetratricopeptide (TPR) repeat protein
MSDGAGHCRRSQMWPAKAGNRLLALVIALFFLAAPQPVPVAGQDLLHEEIGVDYDKLAAGVQAAYAQARAHTLEAARILFPDDGDEYAPDAIETAMALHEASLALVRETEARYAQAYEKIPLLFVQLDYLAVKNLSGMAAIFSLRGELDAAHEMRTTLIPMAEENRSRIALAIGRNILPQFQGQYLEIDDSFRQLLAESYVWMGVDAEAVGNVGEARANYRRALDLSESPDGQDAIRVLLERLDFMHGRAVLTAGGKEAVPTVADPAVEDELPAMPPDPAVGDASDAVPVDAGSDD